MEIEATTKSVRISASKGRDIAKRLQGMSASDALAAVHTSERKAAFHIEKTLKSAIANAENNHDLDVNTLRVRSVTLDGGRCMRRYWPRARGMVSPVQKKTAHVRIVLTDES